MRLISCSTIHFVDNAAAHSDANKRPRVGDGKNAEDEDKSQRTPKRLLELIEKKALDAIKERRKHQPPSPASVSVNATVWCTELKLEINAQIVRDVREDLQAKYRSCSVCYMIRGMEDWSHEAGDSCLTFPLSEETTNGWKHYKDTLKFPGGVMCWNCYLPTVCIMKFKSIQLTLSQPEQEKEPARRRVPRCCGLPASAFYSTSLVRIL